MGRTYEALQRAEAEHGEKHLARRAERHIKAPPPRQTKDERDLEQYEALKHSLLTNYPVDALRSVIVTGTAFGDGSSNTSVNLAVAMAQEAWRSILLIDADLRHPSLHEAFTLPIGKGLYDYLGDESVAAPQLNKIKDNLHLLTTGSFGLNSAGLLDSTRFDDLLHDMEARFNHVIIDCPPVTVFSETRVVANKARGVVLVLNAGKTRKNVAITAKQVLQESNAQILGVVLNRRQFYIPEWLYKKV